MKLESASRQVDFEKAVGAFGNAEPEFRFSGFSRFIKFTAARWNVQ